MRLFSFFSRSPKTRTYRRQTPKVKLLVEALEDRCLPSCNVISGFVYQDANNNGLFDPGETAIANSPIELRNASNQVVGTTSTDGNGFYQFDHDVTISQQPTTLTKILDFPTTQTDYSLLGQVDQFDPNLGTLQSIEVIHEGSITSEIKVENTSPVSTSTIRGTVSGVIQLTGPGVNSTLTIQDIAGSFSASIYDGTKDYAGTSGISFGQRTANGSQTITLTGPALAAYLGTGQVSFTQAAQATSFANGGGNLDVSLNSSGHSKVTVVYHYIPSNCLRPGEYKIIQTQQPAGLFDGQESAGGVVLNHAPGTDFINVALGQSNVTGNNFGELVPAGISGFVYQDNNDNGAKDPGEAGISGAVLTLTAAGGSTTTATTDGNGFYQFNNLQPGSYSVSEAQPSGFFDGKDTAGSTGGTVTNDNIAGITIPPGGNSINNNFGELNPAQLSGFAYQDNNNNGAKEPGEAGIGGVTLTLTAADGSTRTASTDSSGFYQFTNLRPGTYSVTETQPANFLDGQDTAGSLGGTVSNDHIAGIALPSGGTSTNNNFGELAPAELMGYIYVDANDNGIKDPGETPIAGAVVDLSGFDDRGPVIQHAITDTAGWYHFPSLRPGTYGMVETQPTGYDDGKDAIGSQGGVAANDQFTSIALAAGVVGINNNFGEKDPANSDLGIVKTTSAQSVLVGSNFNYTLTITNYGAFTAQNVVVSDPLPAGETLVSATGSGWTINTTGGTLRATLPSLAVGASSQIFVTVKAPATVSTLVNTATVTSNTPDRNPSNNQSTVTTTTFNQPGTVLPRDIDPLVVQLQTPVISKSQLLASSTGGFGAMDAALRGQLAFVDATYQTLTGRAASQSERSAGVQQLNAGMSRDQFTANLWNSDEHLAFEATKLYQTYLHRNPGSSELAATMNVLRSGGSEINIAVSLLTTQEYQNLHPTSEQLVAGFFADIQGKTPDVSTGLLTVQALGAQSINQMVQDMIMSPEGLALIIDTEYRTVLRRAATQAEITFWSSRLQSGLFTPGGLEKALLASGEFYQLAYNSVQFI